MYYEAVLFIIALVLVGRALEARAKHQATRAIGRLVALQPPTARVRVDGGDADRPLAAWPSATWWSSARASGSPVDGVVVDGTSPVDESMLTGEPVPVLKAPAIAWSAAPSTAPGC